MGQGALEQREEETGAKPERGQRWYWGQGWGQSSVADSATKAGKADGGEVSGVHPEEIGQKHRNFVHRGAAGSKTSISRKYT